jgi:hypothetical protein
MTTTCLSTPLPRGAARPGGALWRPALHRALALAPAVLVGGLLLAAVLLAPEQPRELAAICERHNGPIACRVW